MILHINALHPTAFTAADIAWNIIFRFSTAATIFTAIVMRISLFTIVTVYPLHD
jgi:hypothetical protein